MYKTVQIGDVKIGSQLPVFIIAEAGVNHNGDLKLAKDLVLEAKRVGANCVKFQTFKAESLVAEDAPKAKYQLETTDPQESQLQMLKKLELRLEDYKELIELCQKEEIVFISTPYNTEDVDFLDNLGVSAFKLASIHIAEPYFLQYVARKGKPMIVSTGMATLAEVDEAIRAIKETGNEQLIILQCTTNYPSRLEDTNLRAMQTMQDAFNVIVGYSDHTQTDTACLVSLGLGACVIEKHLTLNKSLPGPDQSSSLEPNEFERLVKSIRETEKVLGSNIKEPCEVEKVNAIGMRRSVFTKCLIMEGQEITLDMIGLKRPATGISPQLLPNIIGKKARRNLPANVMIQFSDLV